MTRCANPKCENSVVSKLNKYRLCHTCNYEWYEGGEEYARPSIGANETMCASCGYVFDRHKHKGICPLCNHKYEEGETMISLKEKVSNGKI